VQSKSPTFRYEVLAALTALSLMRARPFMSELGLDQPESDAIRTAAREIVRDYRDGRLQLWKVQQAALERLSESAAPGTARAINWLLDETGVRSNEWLSEFLRLRHENRLVEAVSVVSDRSAERLLQLIEAFIERWGEHRELMDAADAVSPADEWDARVYQDFDPPMTTPLHTLHNLIVIRQLAGMRAEALRGGVSAPELDAFQAAVRKIIDDARAPLTLEGLKSIRDQGEPTTLTDEQLEAFVAGVEAVQKFSAERSSPPLPAFPPSSGT
jgi:hypothetical protein